MTFKHVEQESHDRIGRAGDGRGPSAVAGGVRETAQLRQLQTIVGNRAMGQVLARLAPADTRLDESESVIQPPMMWIKYPPAIPMMTRVELFDAIALLNEWLPKHNYRAELKALREDLRKAGHQVTTPVEYSTFSHWAKIPKSRIPGRLRPSDSAGHWRPSRAHGRELRCNRRGRPGSRKASAGDQSSMRRVPTEKQVRFRARSHS